MKLIYLICGLLITSAAAAEKAADRCEGYTVFRASDVEVVKEGRSLVVKQLGGNGEYLSLTPSKYFRYNCENRISSDYLDLSAWAQEYNLQLYNLRQKNARICFRTDSCSENNSDGVIQLSDLPVGSR